MLLTVGKLLTVRPLPQSQRQCTGALSLPTLLLGVRLSPKVRKAPLSWLSESCYVLRLGDVPEGGAEEFASRTLVPLTDLG